jgi:hypothetical protein
VTREGAHTHPRTGLQRWRKATTVVAATRMFAASTKQSASQWTAGAVTGASTLRERAVDTAASLGLRALETAAVSLAATMSSDNLKHFAGDDAAGA